jgi:hypothetical protein
MGLTISYSEGNGIADDQLNIGVQLPDTNGGNLIVIGAIAPAGSPPDSFGPTTLACPAAPGSGSIYWNVQVDPYVVGGNPSIQQSTSAAPAALASGDGVSGHVQRIVYSCVLTSSTTDPALDAGTTPDPSLGAP